LIAVVDSGPLMALGKLNSLYLLRGLFNKILISKGVYGEVVVKGLKRGSTDAYAVKIFMEREKRVIEIRETEGKFVPKKVDLDRGEKECIELALEEECLILVDEEAARKEARRAGLKVKGTLGIFIMAYRKGIISREETTYLLEEIKHHPDIWISSRLCDKVLEGLEK